MIRFANPWALLGLLLLPLVARRLYRAGAPRLRYSDTRLLADAGPTPRTLLFRHLGVLRLLALALGLVALARPQSGFSTEEVTSEGIDIVLLVDTSGSMRALDFERDGKQVDRLTVVKLAIEDFVERRPSDRIGLVVFGEQAFTQVPLTLDHGLLLGMVDRAEIGMAGERRTAIGSALVTAARRLRDLPAEDKVAVLLTDGRNNAGKVDPETAARIAASYNVRVYTIGAGTTGPVPMPVRDPIFGRRVRYQRADLDEAALRRIAEITGGQYFHAEDTEGLRDVYAQIDKLEQTEVTIERYTTWTERFTPFLLAALAALGLELVLRQTVALAVP